MFISFNGVSNSLPMTAYIKMIDIWMILIMMYPFSVVTLYSVIEFIKDDNTPVRLKEKNKTLRRETSTKIVHSCVWYTILKHL